MAKPLSLTELTAITTLDGRYRKDVVELAPYVSEFNIIRTRVEVEAKFLVALSDARVIRPIVPEERKKLNSFGQNVSLEDAGKIKKIEDEINHDVKAMERAFRTMLTGTSLEDLIENVHMGLTSEDINNLAYRLILKRSSEDILVPNLDLLTSALVQRAEQNKAVPMLARTHGQAAVPTTLGHEYAVFARRLNKEVRNLEKRSLEGKLNGAVGNFNALHDRYPNIDWIGFAEKFVRSFGLEPNLTTTQIAPYEDMIEDFKIFRNKHPGYSYKIYFVGTLENFWQFIHTHMDYLQEGLRFGFDLQNSKYQRFHITQLPAFIITKDGRKYKIAGSGALKEWMNNHAA